MIDLPLSGHWLVPELGWTREERGKVDILAPLAPLMGGELFEMGQC